MAVDLADGTSLYRVRLRLAQAPCKSVNGMCGCSDVRPGVAPHWKSPTGLLYCRVVLPCEDRRSQPGAAVPCPASPHPVPDHHRDHFTILGAAHPQPPAQRKAHHHRDNLPYGAPYLVVDRALSDLSPSKIGQYRIRTCAGEPSGFQVHRLNHSAN